MRLGKQLPRRPPLICCTPPVTQVPCAVCRATTKPWMHPGTQHCPSGERPDPDGCKVTVWGPSSPMASVPPLILPCAPHRFPASFTHLSPMATVSLLALPCSPHRVPASFTYPQAKLNSTMAFFLAPTLSTREDNLFAWTATQKVPLHLEQPCARAPSCPSDC